MEAAWYFEFISPGHHVWTGTDGTHQYALEMLDDEDSGRRYLGLWRMANLNTFEEIVSLKSRLSSGSYSKAELDEIFRAILEVPPGMFDLDTWKMSQAL